MDKRDSIKVVNDQIGSPTWTKDLSEFISTIIDENSKNYGIYNYSGEGQCSWFDFAEAIYREGQESGLIKSDCLIEPCTSDNYPTAAKRPSFSLLSKEKIEKVYGYQVPHWEKSIKRFN